MNTARKTGIYAAKAASKLVKKTAVATEDLIGKTKTKEKKKMKQIKEKKVKYHQKKTVNNRLFTILDTIKKQNSELKN